MTVLLLQIDGSMPNIALMRVAAHHHDLGDSVELRRVNCTEDLDMGLWDNHDKVYASAIFTKSRPLVAHLLCARPDAVVGGTGWDNKRSLEDFEIVTKHQDYSVYPEIQYSIGFTQRGCRGRCKFCVVPEKEGGITSEQTIAQLWRGEPWPRSLILMDNDFFGQPEWAERIEEIRAGEFRVAFTQGINVRSITDAQARAIASVNYRDTKLQRKCVYTAWDNLNEERTVLRGLRRLIEAGVRPGHIMVYMLIGFDPYETHKDREHRRCTLRDLGVDPYPMVYRRNPELLGYQRWVIKTVDKRVSWDEWVRAKYQIRGLRNPHSPQQSIFEEVK